MRVKLTESAISAAAKRAVESGQRQEVADMLLPGLRLRVTANGRRTWILGIRDGLGAARRFQLGEHPGLGISEARDAARGLRAEIKKGADPITEARRKRAIGRDAKDGVGTLKAILDLYAKQKGNGMKSWPECRRRIDNVFKGHLGKPVAVLTARDLQLTADGHRSQQSAAAAVRYLRPVLKWAAHRDYLSAAVAVLHPPATVARRDRVLTRDELAALLPVLRASGRPYAAAIQFMLLTLARREEVGGARWRAINMETGEWTIRETKNGEPHVVPLPQQALDMLIARRPENAKSDALVFATRTGEALANWDRETKALQKASKTGDWTRHDLRRTGATLLGEMGELPDIIEAALNHVSIRSALAATYNRSRYRPQVAKALQRLADALDGIETGGAKVIQLHRQVANAG